MKTSKHGMCDQYVEWNRKKNDLKFRGIDKCPHPAKYSVSYRSTTNGKIKAEAVCGKHLSHLKKSCASILKRTGWDAALQITLISDTTKTDNQ